MDWISRTPTHKNLILWILLLIGLAAIAWIMKPAKEVLADGYKLAGSHVSFHIGDLRDTGAKDYVESQILAFGTKIDLGYPEVEGSFDHWFFKEMCPGYSPETIDTANKNPLCKKFYTWRQENRSPSKFRSLPLPKTFSLDGRNITFVTVLENKGIAKDIDDLGAAKRLEGLSTGIIDLIENSPPVDIIAMPIIGTGAAGIKYTQALDAILTGINDVLIDSESKRHIKLIVWSNDTALALKQTIFQGMIEDSSSSIWKSLEIYLLSIQIPLLLLAPLAGALITLHLSNGALRLTNGATISAVVIQITVALGFKVGEETIIQSIPTVTFIILFIVGMLLPVWKWMGFGETRNLNE